VAYDYKGGNHTLPISVDTSGVSAENAAKTTEAPLDFSINVDKVTVAAEKNTTSSSKQPYIIWVIVGLAALAVVIVLIHRRRKSNPFEQIVEDNYKFNTSSDPHFTEQESTDGPAADEPGQPVFPPLDGSDGAPEQPPPIMPAAEQPVALAGRHDAQSHHALVDIPPEAVIDPTAGQPNEPKSMYLPENSPEHMGLSLKQMVLRSMAEAERQQRAKRQAEDDLSDQHNGTHHRQG
jgi:hypothetical protein